MCAWKGHGLRGSTLEDMLNRTNDCYRQNRLALIQKIPTPITPVEMNESRQITLAYFDKKSTVDYIGSVQGIPVCFDAKECATNTFPLQNIHAHQIAFMREFEQQNGIAFIILYYTERNELYYVPFPEIEAFWNRMEAGGRKSFTYDELGKQFPIRQKGEYLVHYLEPLSGDIAARDTEAG